jgi:membrane fusion protein, copper/silver efflux system
MTRVQLITLAITGVLIAGGAGFLAGRQSRPAGPVPTQAEESRKVLYWYDPMVPGQHFTEPGRSPYMDMQLVPKYADEAGAGETPGVRIDAAKTQNLGVRLAKAVRGELPSALSTTGVIEFNERDLAVVQAKASGFVQRTYGHAPGDVVRAGAPLADLLVPEWAGAQGEYLAVRRTGDEALIRAARQRLQLLGMPPSLIANEDLSGRVRNVTTVTTPVGGAIKSLGVRTGMTVAAGQTLAELNGVSRVWLNAAVPEAMAGQVRLGQAATATLTAFPGEAFNGRVTAILPEAQAESRTLTVRIEMPNPAGRLRPGMFATVQFAGAPAPALLVPSEAVIRTGRRTLVMLGAPDGQFRPAEVRTGREAGGKTEILAGLSEGEQVVASGQFLIDSEANLSGVEARPVTTGSAPDATPTLVEGMGRIEEVKGDWITLSHGPIPALQWPAMTMQFRLADPTLARGFKTGDRVTFAFAQERAGPTVRRLQKAPVQ